MNLIPLLVLPTVFMAVVIASIGARVNRTAARGQLDLGDDEVARLPERLGLVRLDVTCTPVPSVIASVTAELESHGFEDGGLFAIEGMTGVRMRLLAQRAQSMYATVWEHPTAGSWYEFWTLYPGGNKCTFTTLTGQGLEGRPGHMVVRVPKAQPLELYLKACTERPMGVYMPTTATQAEIDFENGYMIWRSWRRGQERDLKFEAAA